MPRSTGRFAVLAVLTVVVLFIFFSRHNSNDKDHYSFRNRPHWSPAEENKHHVPDEPATTSVRYPPPVQRPPVQRPPVDFPPPRPPHLNDETYEEKLPSPPPPTTPTNPSPPSLQLPQSKSDTLTALEDLLHPRQDDLLGNLVTSHNRKVLEALVECSYSNSCVGYQSKGESFSLTDRLPSKPAHLSLFLSGHLGLAFLLSRGWFLSPSRRLL